MKKKYGIGFLVVIIIIFVIILFVSKIDTTDNLEEGFILHEQDGYVIVLNLDNSIYDFTTIEVKNLPEEIQREIKSGMKLESLEELYGFLENYSS